MSKNQEKRANYYLYIDGQAVPVSEQVYRVYQHYERKEERWAETGVIFGCHFRRGDYKGDLKILPHGLLKIWGEPCGARVKRHCGVMKSEPTETGDVPIVRDAWQIWRKITA